MNIHFSKVRYKNLLATGNTFIEIDLSSHHTTLISGKNGSGKSSMLDALIFALYGKPLRKINKPQLMNTINNKELVCEVEFSIGPISYLVRRGIKPAIFEIFKNGELINQDSAKRDYQEYLEKNILKMSFKSFTQIVVLGSATYTPFMELPTGGRREVIEDLLDIQIFSTMNILLKEKMSANKSDIIDTDHSIEIQKTKLDSANKHNKEIMSLKLLEVDKIKERMQYHLSVIDENVANIKFVDFDRDSIITSISDKKTVKDKLSALVELKSDISSKLRQQQNDSSFYHDNDTCPTCKQGIEHDFKKSIIEKSSSLQSELSVGRDKIADRIDKLNVRLFEITVKESELNDLNMKINSHKATIESSKSALISYKKDLKDAEKEVELIASNSIKELEDAIKTFQEKQTANMDYRDVLAVSSAMLKDGGIKTKIIQQYIPIMNTLINKYLSVFELFVDFNLDETFNEVIKSRFRDTFSYSNFSEGEKLRISLCILFAWRAVAKMRNSVSTNLLFFDEILDGALDVSGVETLLNTLKELNKSDNIFIISHRGEAYGDKFDNHLRFEKYKNFSRISINDDT